jgi:hypothetical protein
MNRIGWRPALLAVLVLSWSSPAAAEDQKEARRLGWANATDLSFVVTEGNSNTETFGLKNTLERIWERSNLTLKLEGLRSDTADDRFRQVDPGLTWEPGETPPSGTTSLVEPASEPDAERYHIGARFERTLKRPPLIETDTTAATWNTGASWGRDRDAGILRRITVFAGFGHIWRDQEDFRFRTSYGLSFTDRKEETVDPEKEQQFPGFLLSSHFLDTWGAQTTFTNDWKFNLNLEDTADYSSDMTSAVSVSMSSHLSLKIGLQWIFNSEPALEDIDVVAQVNLVDPDGIPGNGDEFFETVASGGTVVEIGSTQERKKQLDTVVRTSLVIKF